jgi:hypothetical protein
MVLERVVEIEGPTADGEGPTVARYLSTVGKAILRCCELW